MSRALDRIDEDIKDFLEAQKVFFVATAPMAAEGLVNVSPKGLDGTFAVIDDRTVAYLDLTGSGVETIAHVKENGRICLMFCAFDGRPRIVRIHGTGRVIERGAPGFVRAAAAFPEYQGARSVIWVEATRISESCGFGVPRYTYESNRDQLTKWATAKGADEIADYQRERNATSLDGLPGFEGSE